MHDLSFNKLPLLNCAKESYFVAMDFLLESSKLLQHDLKEDQSLENSPVKSDCTSPPYTPTHAPRRPLPATATMQSLTLASSASWRSLSRNWVSSSQAALANDPAFGTPLQNQQPLQIARIWLSQSQVSFANDSTFGSPVRRPSPLRIMKSILNAEPPVVESLLATPLLTRTPKKALRISIPSTICFSASTTTWLHDRALQRYNTHSNDFHQMLYNHVKVVDTLIKSTSAIQANRHRNKLASRDNSDEARALDKRVRIEKLKAKGWKRERFMPERYQYLCARALAEL